MKVWLELAVKNVKDIKKQIQEQIKGVDLKGITEKARTAGGQIPKALGPTEDGKGILESLKEQLRGINQLVDKAKTIPELSKALKQKENIELQIKKAMDTGKTGTGIGKLAMTAGAALGVLFVIKKLGAKMLAQLVKSSPYLQGILSVMGRAWMLFWRPFGDFLGNLLRPLAISLLRLSMKWLGYTRTPEGKKVVEAGIGAGIGGLGGAAIGGIVGMAGGPVGVLIGTIVGGITGAFISLLPEAWDGVKNLVTVITAWMDYFVLEVLGIDMDKVRASVATFMLITIPDFFTKTLPEFFDNAIAKLGDLGSWLWDELTEGMSNISGILSGWASWVWSKITGALNNLWDFLSPWAGWIWTQITDPLSNIWITLVKYAEWVWLELKDPLKNIYWTLVGFGGWLYDKITSAFNNIGAWLSGVGMFLYNKITESIIQAFKGFTFGWSWWWNKEASYQHGTNFVPETGMYKLHKGEKVVTAPRAADTSGKPSIVLSPVFNIYGRNDESDINSQVRRAARMLEFEVRRGYLL